MKLDFETAPGLGHRATLGAIVLQTDESLEPELSKMTAGYGIALYHSRIPMVTEVQPDTLAKMLQDLPDAARLLPASAGFDVIGYGCTSASSVIGSEAVETAVQQVFPQAKVTNPLAAIIAGLKHLNARRLAFVTPYIAEVSQKMRERLQDAGFEIAAFGSFEEGDDSVVAKISEPSIRTAAETVAAQADCDAIVISCTNLRALNVINQIEAETGLPVLTSNQALAWHMMRLAGVATTKPQFGRLWK